MPFYRSNYYSDDSEVDAVVIDRSPEVRSLPSTRPRHEGLTFGFKLFDLFRSKKTKIVRVVEEAPVRRASPEGTTRQVRFSSDSYSPPLTRRAAGSRMADEAEAEGFTPLPPKIRKSSSEYSDDDYNIENRAPKGKGKSSRSSKYISSHKRKDSKLDREPEFIEVPSSPRRSEHESDAERARRKQAERKAERERELRTEAVHVASQHADIAKQERRRREEVEGLGRAFEQAYIGEHREAEAAKARADALAKQLKQERDERDLLERKADILEREKRVARAAEDLERVRPVLRPVDIFQDAPRPISRDAGDEIIRRAQEDAQRRRQNMRDDDSLYGRQREQRRERRGERVIFDDDAGRRGHRRQ